ncbi:MAG: hypothetical protein Q8R08_04875 [bacterium]|nr:hypothetical protein [bacterium]
MSISQTLALTQLLLTKQDEQNLVSTLSQGQLTSWEHWNHRLASERAWLAMLSTSFRNGSRFISPDDAKKNDRRFGSFVDWYSEWEIEDIAREDFFNNPALRPCKRAIHIGAGTGLGMKYLISAFEAGLKLEVYDWLLRALVNAGRALRPLFKVGEDPNMVLKLGEARQVCQTLNTSVAFLQIVRVIEHMDEAPAAETLQGAGHILADPANRIMIGDALAGPLNDSVSRETCRHYDKDFILHNLGIGAGRPVRIFRSKTFEDAEKLFTFLTVRG